MNAHLPSAKNEAVVGLITILLVGALVYGATVEATGSVGYASLAAVGAFVAAYLIPVWFEHTRDTKD